MVVCEVDVEGRVVFILQGRVLVYVALAPQEGAIQDDQVAVVAGGAARDWDWEG